MNAPPRLSPSASSRKLQALDAIKRYYAQWGHSPTLGELSALLGISAKRAHDLVHQLAVSKMIEHQRGKARGIRLLDPLDGLSEADVLVMLARRGWVVGKAGRILDPDLGTVFPVPEGPLPPDLSAPLAAAGALTDQGLTQLPQLHHEEGSGDVGSET